MWQKHVCRRTQHPCPKLLRGYSTQFACRRSSRTKNGPRTAGEYSPAASIQDSQYSRPVTFGELKIVGAAASKDLRLVSSRTGHASKSDSLHSTRPSGAAARARVGAAQLASTLRGRPQTVNIQTREALEVLTVCLYRR